MKYLLILLFMFSMPASAEFIQLINTSQYDQSNYLVEARYDALRGRGTPLILAGRSRLNGFSPRHFRRFYRY